MKTRLTAEQLVRIYDLRPHPEGGYFRETYRSDESIPGRCLPARYHGDRCYSTAIYYLLLAGSVSRLHRIASDEIWHSYLGGPLTIVEFEQNGSVKRVVLGPDIEDGHQVQHVVPGGTWFGAYPNPGSDYCFVGCTVAPGFNFSDFEIANRRDLLQQYPQEQATINLLS